MPAKGLLPGGRRAFRRGGPPGAGSAPGRQRRRRRGLRGLSTRPQGLSQVHSRPQRPVRQDRANRQRADAAHRPDRGAAQALRHAREGLERRAPEEAQEVAVG